MTTQSSSGSASTGRPLGVLVGVDGSDEAQDALAWAVAEARHRGCGVTALSAWLPLAPVPLGAAPGQQDVQAREEAAESYVADALAAIGDTGGVRVTTEVVMAPAAAALVERSDDAELVVVGSRGLGGFGDLLLGSVSRQVATHARCPVVVLRAPDEKVEPGPETGRVVVGVDTSRTAEDPLGFAFRFAADRGLGLTAVHTWEPAQLDVSVVGSPVVTDLAEVADDEARALAVVLDRWTREFPDVDVRRQVVPGRPAPALLDRARGAELLVVGSRGRGGFVGLLLGSVSHTVLHHAPCPVAVVRTAG